MGGGRGPRAELQRGRRATVRSAGVGRRRAGCEDSMPFREGRQVCGAWGEGGRPPGGTAVQGAVAPREGPADGRTRRQRPREEPGEVRAGGPRSGSSSRRLYAVASGAGLPSARLRAGGYRAAERLPRRAGGLREAPIVGRGRRQAGGARRAGGGCGGGGAGAPAAAAPLCLCL